ncbi:hypothetical protein GGE12_005426 [Rhizobium mongolense]|uniref:Uncharacterized protein n=1 Tax=Rhizobium mongolense TaxID=57676 RepID=A0A7W6RS67_9HYPH|nr:hypothetical protein [Rhizobium mongolense]
MSLEPEALGHGGVACGLVKPLFGPRDAERAILLEAGRLSGFRFERSIKLSIIFSDLGQRMRAACLHNQAGSMPRRAGGKGMPLKNHDVLFAQLRQVIGKACPGNAAPNDNNFMGPNGRLSGANGSIVNHVLPRCRRNIAERLIRRAGAGPEFVGIICPSV